MRSALVSAIATGLLAAPAAGCGSSSSPPAAARALSADATSAATGDIPDNQRFLTYHNPAEHYSIVYPEGWALKGTGRDVSFTDKNNIVHIIIAAAPTPTTAAVAGELTKLRRSNPSLTYSSPATVALGSAKAVKAIYTTRSAPNPVTGKSVLLIVDRYELARAGKRATVDLGTPKGVDNVDAYRKMIDSFHWQ